MADDPNPKMPDEPYDDVPRSNAIVKSGHDANYLARRMAGQLPPNESRFHCLTCGWSGTLKFSDDEMEGLGHDISNYSGPCSQCQCQTLVLYSKLFGQDLKSVNERAKEARREEWEEGADIMATRLRQEVVGMVGGSIFEGGPEIPTPEQTSAGTRAAERDEYPDESEIDVSNLKPRK